MNGSFVVGWFNIHVIDYMLFGQKNTTSGGILVV